MSDNNEKENIQNSEENNNQPLTEQTPVTNDSELVREPRRVSLQTFAVTVIALVLAAVMLTYTVCNSMYKERLNQSQIGNVTQGSYDSYDKLDLIRGLFEQYSYLDVDDEAALDAVIRAYVAQTGDRYAVYYNAEEYAAHLTSVSGNTVGIGITVVSEVINHDGAQYYVMNVVGVTAGGSAESAGIKVGDKIAWIGNEDSETLVGDMPSYSEAVNSIRGAEGTFADFAVLRENESGYEKLRFSVERKSIEVPTVTFRVSEADPKVGIVRITQFNYNTPAQFTEAMDELISKGCENVVFDVRANPGGSLDSVVAILSYFLPADSKILSTVDASGATEITYVKEITNKEGDLASCNVSAEDIGKYRESFSKMAVLCDGDSASAAELFTATFRDYSLATIVGVKTYGKGSMQSVISLAPYGYTGGLRLTTRMYFPPCGEGYDGIGITPTENYNVELSDAAKEYAIDSLPEELDDQLRAAIKSFE